MASWLQVGVTTSHFFCFSMPHTPTFPPGRVSSFPPNYLLSSSCDCSSFRRHGVVCANFLNEKKKPPLRCSSSNEESLNEEVIKDSKFVPLNEDDPGYGPPALLLIGFEVDEELKIRQFLKELDGEFLKVIFCTEDMIPKSLWEAMHANQPNLKTLKVAKSLPRICFLSGLTGEEMMMFIDAFPETGLEPAAFAAMVPNSANKPLSELIEEIMGDHEMLTSKEAGQV